MEQCIAIVTDQFPGVRRSCTDFVQQQVKYESSDDVNTMAAKLFAEHSKPARFDVETCSKTKISTTNKSLIQSFKKLHNIPRGYQDL